MMGSMQPTHETPAERLAKLQALANRRKMAEPDFPDPSEEVAERAQWADAMRRLQYRTSAWRDDAAGEDATRDDLHEEDEPAEDLFAKFDTGEKGLTAPSAATVEELTLAQQWERFDSAARRYFGLDGPQFAARWRAGAYRDDSDPRVTQVAMLLPDAWT